MNAQPLPKRLLAALESRSQQRALRFYEKKQIREMTCQEMARQAQALGQGLIALGVKAGDRVLLYAPNSPDLLLMDLAILSVGAVGVMAPGDLVQKDLQGVVAATKPKLAVTSPRHQMVQSLQTLAIPTLILLTNRRGTSGVVQTPLPGSLTAEQLIAEGKGHEEEWRRRLEEVVPESPATIALSAGTTGPVKLIPFSHGQLGAFSLEEATFLGATPSDVYLIQRGVSMASPSVRQEIYTILLQGALVAFAPQRKLKHAVKAVKATIVRADPNYFRGWFSYIIHKKAKGSGLRPRLFRWCIKERKKTRAPVKGLTAKASFGLAKSLHLNRLERHVGLGVRAFICNGEGLSTKMQRFYADLGVPIISLYELAEVAGPVVRFFPSPATGRLQWEVARGMELRIEDSHILVRGPSVALKGDAQWLDTGDLGCFREDGMLLVEGRSSEVIPLEGDDRMSLRRMEDHLIVSPLCRRVALFPVLDRTLVALIVPHGKALERVQKSLKLAVSRGEKVRNHPEIQAIYRKMLDQRMALLRRDLKVDQFFLLGRRFLPIMGETTHKRGLRRPVIAEKFKTILDAMMKKAAQAPVPTES